METLDFALPHDLEAAAPPETRGLARDDVRLMVSHYTSDRVLHTRFRNLVQHVHPGDLLVINTSGTLNAALPATRAGGEAVELHLSTRLPDGCWTVELRRMTPTGTRPIFTAAVGETLRLPAGGSVTLGAPYRSALPPRLWVAELRLPDQIEHYLEAHGVPIRYGYVAQPWPASYYQTVFVTEMGSAEMPSAGRAFTPELVTRLVAGGVRIAPLLLHTGVASLESNEAPYEEYYRVPATTARAVNETRAAGGQVIAVGTTVVRALETVADDNRLCRPGEGWTEIVISPQRPPRLVDGLLTGFHEPKASHLAMLAAICREEHLHIAYAAALERRYLWHEFGDLHLIVP